MTNGLTQSQVALTANTVERITFTSQDFLHNFEFDNMGSGNVAIKANGTLSGVSDITATTVLRSGRATAQLNFPYDVTYVDVCSDTNTTIQWTASNTPYSSNGAVDLEEITSELEQIAKQKLINSDIL